MIDMFTIHYTEGFFEANQMLIKRRNVEPIHCNI